MSASSTLIKPRQLQRLSAAFVALLLIVASLLLTGVQPAAAAGNGQLNVRATAVECAFTNVLPGDSRVPAESGTACVDVPGRWYPSETANSQAIQVGSGADAVCPTSIKERAQNIPAAMGGSSVATGDLECNGRTHSTPNLHASIFSGVDANGLPDLPAANAEWPAAGAVQSCTVTNAQVTDLGEGTCGIKGVNRTSAQYYVMDGYVSFPAVVSGNVKFQASNIGVDGVARAEYLAFMASSDSSMENLAFVGEAQTARDQVTEFTAPVNVSTDVTSQCSNVRAIRLYMQDNVEGSSATLRWDIGNGLEAIPTQYVSNTVPSIEGCKPPTAVDNAETTNPGVPVDSIVLANDTKGSAELDPTTVRFLDGQGTSVDTVTVPGEGVWTVNKTTGVVTFSPIPAFTGVTKPVRYEVFDSNGLSAQAKVVVTVRTPPKAVDNAETTNPGVPVDSIVLANDTKGSAEIDPTTVRFVAGGTPVDSVVVDGEGVWTVDKTTGVVTFAPEAAFTGVTTSVRYQITDLNKLTAQANVIVTINMPPKAVDNAETTNPGVPVDSIVLNNDTKGSAELDPTTVRFLAGGTLVDSVTVPGEGVWTVNKQTGVVTFSPEAAFTGVTTPVKYQVTDLNKLTAEANVVVTVRTPPKAVDNAETTNPGVSVDSIVLANDTKGSAELDPTTVRFIGPEGELLDTVVVDGEGTWTVDKTTGVVTFSPEADFTGKTTPVRYQVTDLNQLTAEAKVVVTVRTPPKAVDNAETTKPGVPVDSIVLDNDTKGSAELDPTTVRFVDVDGSLVDMVAVPGEGTWTVDKTTGVVTFTPEGGFTGDTTPVRYGVADLNGLAAEANVTVTVTAPPVVPLLGNAPAPVDAPMDPAPVTAAPVLQDDLAATGVSSAVLVISAALVLLGGVAMVLTTVRRRQQEQ